MFYIKSMNNRGKTSLIEKSLINSFKNYSFFINLQKNIYEYQQQIYWRRLNL